MLFAAFAGNFGELFSVPVHGGAPAPLPVPGLTGGFFFQPEFLPDGETFLFAWSLADDQEAGLYLASLKQGRVTSPVLLRKGMTAGHYSAAHGGELLWLASDSLYAQHLSLRAPSRLTGQPRKVLDGVHSINGQRRPSFSVSRNGVLVWTSGHANTAQLTWFDRRGHVVATAGQSIEPDYIRIAPDGKHILITPAIGPTRIVETGRDGYQPVPGVDRGLWTPDGTRLIYREYGPSGDRIVERTLSTGQVKELFSEKTRVIPWDLSPDGRILLYQLGIPTKRALWFRRIDGTAGPPRQILERGGLHAKFSPDGKSIVYVGPADRPQIYVQAFPNGGLTTQITSDRGQDPVWRGDGKEIIFRWNAILFSVRVEAHGEQFKVSEPEPLFRVKVPTVVAMSEIAGISRDGSRILFAQSTVEDLPQTVYMMTSWDITGQ